jgi:hypothetical protein
MGYLTAVMLYNDTLDDLCKDKDLGKHLNSAVCGWYGRDRDPYILEIGRSQSRVVSCGHADYPQIVMLWRNSAYAFSDQFDQHVTDEIIDFAIRELQQVKRSRARRKTEERGTRDERTAPSAERQPGGSGDAVLDAEIVRVHTVLLERLKLKYAGDCECGNCFQVPGDVIMNAANLISYSLPRPMKSRKAMIRQPSKPR